MRDRAWRRAQTKRYKEKQIRDVANLMGSGEAERRKNEGQITDSRHTLDCGRRCFMCHGDKLLCGHKQERQETKRLIEGNYERASN